jgi:hypothetical protein
MTENPRVFGADYSVYVRIVRLCLIEKGVNYELLPIDVFAKEGPIDRGTRLKMRVDRNQRLRPEALIGVGGIDLRTDFRRMNLRKGTSERLVSLYQCLIEIEDIH